MQIGGELDLDETIFQKSACLDFCQVGSSFKMSGRIERFHILEPLNKHQVQQSEDRFSQFRKLLEIVAPAEANESAEEERYRLPSDSGRLGSISRKRATR